MVERILIVDDDELVLRSVARMLRGKEDGEGGGGEGGGEGRVLTIASDAESALAAIRAGSFDVVVSDVRMPNLSGIELLREVRRTDLDVPVILMSGSVDVQTAMDAVELGAFRYLAKPLDTHQLKSVVERAVQLGRLAAAKREALLLAGHDEKLLGDRASLEERFASGLKKLFMVFQPIVSHRRDGVTVAYEALLRTGEETLQNPAAFLAAGERLGRLHDIGRAVRRAVAERAADAPADASLFVNLHPADLLDADLFRADAPLTKIAQRVVLELTERASLDGLADVQERVAALRRLGYRIALDDLGSGYAGLNCLMALEPDIVKLDMVLVRDIDSDRRRQEVVRSLLALCRSLDMSVVIEGIETTRERDVVVSYGANLMQGWLFAKPARSF